MLRPVTFTVLTSTRLELVFNKNVGNISTENFAISSVDGNISDLKITSIQVSEKGYYKKQDLKLLEIIISFKCLILMIIRF